MKHILSLFVFFIFSLQSLQAQLAKKYKTYSENHYHGMRYGLFKPTHYDSKKTYPLIVYLHGSRDTVSHDMKWYQESQTKNPCFVLTPKCEASEQGWGNTWQDGHTEAMTKTLKLVDSLVQHYHIDTNRLYLYGISMGGFGVFSVLAKEKGKFAAAYAVCGGSNANAADKLMSTPLWIFHGEKDDIVLVKYSRDVYHEMVRLGGKTVRYTEYPGVKHDSWENVGQEKTLDKWLFLQQKSRTSVPPDQVTNMVAELQNSTGVKLTWTKPNAGSKPDKEVWYYKVFRDGKFLTEIDSEATTYSDLNLGKSTSHSYYLVAVNYFFKESIPSEAVTVK